MPRRGGRLFDRVAGSPVILGGIFVVVVGHDLGGQLVHAAAVAAEPFATDQHDRAGQGVGHADQDQRVLLEDQQDADGDQGDDQVAEPVAAARKWFVACG